MIIGDKTYLRHYEINIQNDLNKRTRTEKQNKISKKIKRKKGKNPDNNICKDLKRRIDIANRSQKTIKEKLELAKFHENKLRKMENTLKEIKSHCQKDKKDDKQKQIKNKIKIKKIKKETNDLGHEYKVVRNFLNDDKNMIASLNEALENINHIKKKLSDYKSKLLDIEKYVNRTKKEFESKEKIIKKHIESEEYINEKVLINPLDFIFIDDDLNIGVSVNIFV
ncbi:Uncharacterised protein [uncultured Clostridium sp.]|nr:Uncharacterised protein [uncultured Clostridium sp.]SCI94024.1 Uncharacterised protein [uncultured Clostridium sp.]